MVMLRCFKGVRPAPQYAEQVASFPYDVINSQEARELAQGNPYSFLHVVKPEIDLPEDIDLYDERVYQTAKNNFYKLIDDKILIQDETPNLYIYKQKMGDHEQYGLVGCVSADDYNNDKIKKHELTRKAKEDDRTKHVLTVNANTGPVFLTYPEQEDIDQLISDFVRHHQPVYDFVKEDGIGHTFWIVEDKELQNRLIEKFANIEYLYVADGHHRSASAARAKAEKMKLDPNPSEDKEYNYFLAVIFPANQLKILDYNRVVFTLGELSTEEFLDKVAEKFDFIKDGDYPTPKQATHFGMYIDGKWKQIAAKPGTYPVDDPVESLDVAILQNNLLAPILNIGDPRTDSKIDFVGGIRGFKELERRVDEKEAAVAFQLYPTSIKQLLNVANAGKIMPPKSTWFEPKLRSGLISHLLD